MLFLILADVAMQGIDIFLNTTNILDEGANGSVTVHRLCCLWLIFKAVKHDKE